MTRLTDNFDRRPDNRAGDIIPIWPEELQPQDCGVTRRWEWALVLTVATVMIGGGVAWAVWLT